MKRIFIRFLAFLLLTGIVVSCNNGNKDVNMSEYPIVSVGENTLYKKQLDDMMPLNYLKSDSAKIADVYVRNWVDEVLMYEKAKQNISNQRTIDELVENYRRTLTIHSYQEDLIIDKARTEITESKLEEYYDKHKDVFLLEAPIIKGLYLKIPLESPEVGNFKKWYSTGKDREIENIEKNALQHTVGYELFYNKWVDFDDIMTMIPMNISDNAQFLRQYSTINISDSSFVYLLHIKEYKLKGDIAPFEYIEQDIHKAILGQERNVFLKQIEQDLYERALGNKTIKFYNK